MKKLLLAFAMFVSVSVLAQTNDLNSQLSNMVVSFDTIQKQIAQLKATQNTNAPVIYYDATGHPIATNAPAITPQSTTAKLETYAKIILGIIGAILTLGSQVMVAARWLRKSIPNDLQTGTLGQVLRHVGAEINPPKQEALKENPATNIAPPAPPIPEPPKV